MKTIKLVLSGVLLSFLFMPAVSQADSFSVYVGYADNLRASGFFPTPWLGDPNVVSQTPSGQSLDTGAVRIDNTGASSLLITNFSVKLGGGQVFSIWNPLTIAPGKIGIFTQTASYNFDSSDFGYFGGGPVNVDAAHPLGGFTNPQGAAQIAANVSWAPVVSFMENSNPFSYNDSGHILDTFGYDLINLPAPGGDGNESINWITIGRGGTRGGNVPEPSTMLLFGTGIAGLVGYKLRKKE
jgi:hypothetical protein